MIPLMMSSAFATTLLTEDFGSLTSAGCSSAWSGDCEIGWNAVGPSGSVSSCEVDGDDVVWLHAATNQTAGLSRTVTLASDDDLVDWGAEVDAHSAGDLTLKILFRDASGNLVQTEESVESVQPGSYLASIVVERPASASTAEVQLRFSGTDTTSGGLPVRRIRFEGMVRPLAGVCSQRAEDRDDARRESCEGRSNEAVLWTYEGECTGHWTTSGCVIECEPMLWCVPHPLLHAAAPSNCQ
ncbi:MAG: hypothetical protein H6738_09400 [Alphaproteobacteria bacterium]|nr:hypothetical protein [Alphaproteobacteria bacterium]